MTRVGPPQGNLVFCVCTCQCNVIWWSITVNSVINCHFKKRQIPVASKSASRLGPTSHAITSISSLSGLISRSSPASSSNSCPKGLAEAGIRYTTNWVTSIGEAWAFPSSVFLASRRCKSYSFFEWGLAASSILEADWDGVWYRWGFGS